jgi:bifunctional non-homologous end joining protein LigD
VEVTNPDKVLFPDAGFTKADLVGHYERFGARMLLFVIDSPLTLERYPNGIGSKGFRQKNASDHFPDYVGRVEIPKREDGVTVYPTVDSTDGLVYLANQGTITFHPWTSRLPDLDRPDFLVLDLDPTEGDVERVRQVARTTHALLEEFGLESMLATSGSKGFHIWVPIVADHAFDIVGTVARALAGLIAARDEDATTEFLKDDRAGRVFVDWLRNGWGSSIAAPWSVRAREGAPVVTPIPWDQLDRTVPDQWSIRDVEQAHIVELPPSQNLDHDRITDAALDVGVDLETQFDRFGRKR